MAKRAATDAYKNAIYDPKVEKTNKTLFEPNNYFFFSVPIFKADMFLGNFRIFVVTTRRCLPFL